MAELKKQSYGYNFLPVIYLISEVQTRSKYDYQFKIGLKYFDN